MCLEAVSTGKILKLVPFVSDYVSSLAGRLTIFEMKCKRVSCHLIYKPEKRGKMLEWNQKQKSDLKAKVKLSAMN